MFIGLRRFAAVFEGGLVDAWLLCVSDLLFVVLGTLICFAGCFSCTLFLLLGLWFSFCD